jgi:hypothetical protein
MFEQVKEGKLLYDPSRINKTIREKIEKDLTTRFEGQAAAYEYLVGKNTSNKVSYAGLLVIFMIIYCISIFVKY